MTVTTNQNKKKKIIYFTQNWVSNIGNLFIDMGALISLDEAIKIYEGEMFSVMPIGTLNLWSKYIYMSKLISQLKPLWKLVKPLFPQSKLSDFMVQPSDSFNLAEIIEADYTVFSGWFLTTIHFKTYDKLLEKLVKKGVKIIFYGVGGDQYSSSEVIYIRDKLKKIKPYLLITRDSIAFEKYSDLAENSFDGLDAAFYVNRFNFLKDIKLNIVPYVVLTFDRAENRETERRLEKEYKENGVNVIKCSHVPYSRPSEKFVSESPFDYLILYSHATEVHSDRVHACVVALSFGNKCKLYTRDIRSSLLSKACEGDITKELCPLRDISKLMRKQINILSQTLQK